MGVVPPISAVELGDQYARMYEAGVMTANEVRHFADRLTGSCATVCDTPGCSMRASRKVESGKWLCLACIIGPDHGRLHIAERRKYASERIIETRQQTEQWLIDAGKEIARLEMRIDLGLWKMAAAVGLVWMLAII